ncbi:hypothetical protein ASE36_19590 [Rhizobium sp. Root274]|uniref:DUF3307 domain-containing protein n=1 Tax=unclassified Rhizobium TaxID=2613769 RepID=UPI0007160A58|nr:MULTISPECIES: DUF3307 domain-containing protein [unclassified Rhizobium]KQW27156.1 hypothetical protein ASC71_19080 [Rhizobium sp. Root1240]KRD26632.1 hypothetical protein ASE36_19590 [Rhizobium sp. Root274]
MPIIPEQISAHVLIWATALFILKQLVADFLLQTAWMAKGKERQTGWVAPLGAHVAIHALCTLAICVALLPQLAWLALVDLVVHAAIDRSKSLLQARFQFTPVQSGYWWMLGLDQTLHHATHLVFAIALAAASFAG